MSRVFASNVNATTTTGRDTLGLIARFTVREIPESGVLASLFGTGLAGFAFRKMPEKSVEKLAL